jgi:hypothetical protein
LMIISSGSVNMLGNISVGAWWHTTHHGVTRDDDWWASTYAEPNGERKETTIYTRLGRDARNTLL